MAFEPGRHANDADPSDTAANTDDSRKRGPKIVAMGSSVIDHHENGNAPARTFEQFDLLAADAMVRERALDLSFYVFLRAEHQHRRSLLLVCDKS